MTGSGDPRFPSVVAVGASAGGVEALVELIANLPRAFPAPILVVLHVAPQGTSVLATILGRHAQLAVVNALHGEVLEAGCVYVAPPDRHLLVSRDAICLSRGPRENGHRPAVDPTFRAVAAAWRERAIGVILSGMRDDGSRGLAEIKASGGRALVQDPAECLYPGMPQSAMRATEVDAVLPVAALARQLVTHAEHPETMPVSWPGGPVTARGD